MAQAQLGELAPQRVHRQALDRCVQRRAPGGRARRRQRLPGPQRLPGVVRRIARWRGLRRACGGAGPQRTGRRRPQRRAVDPLHRQQRARSPHHHLARRVRPAHQCRQDRRLGRVQPAGQLAQQHLRRRRHADQLAAHRHAVQIGLQDLRLRPARLDLPRRGDLPELARDAAPAGRARQVAVDQAGQLHRDRGGALRGAAARQIGPGAARQTRPVDAGVGVEAVVLGQHDRRAQRGREAGQRDPGLATGGRIDADRLDRLAVAVEQDQVGGAVRGADFRIRRQRQRQRHRTRPPHRHPRESGDPPAPPPSSPALRDHHGFLPIRA